MWELGALFWPTIVVKIHMCEFFGLEKPFVVQCGALTVQMALDPTKIKFKTLRKDQRFRITVTWKRPSNGHSLVIHAPHVETDVCKRKKKLRSDQMQTNCFGWANLLLSNVVHKVDNADWNPAHLALIFASVSVWICEFPCENFKNSDDPVIIADQFWKHSAQNWPTTAFLDTHFHTIEVSTYRTQEGRCCQSN